MTIGCPIVKDYVNGKEYKIIIIKFDDSFSFVQTSAISSLPNALSARGISFIYINRTPFIKLNNLCLHNSSLSFISLRLKNRIALTVK